MLARTPKYALILMGIFVFFFVISGSHLVSASFNHFVCTPDSKNSTPILSYHHYCDPVKLTPTSKFQKITNPQHSFSLLLPINLDLVTFTNGTGFNLPNIPAHQNLIFSLDLKSNRPENLSNLRTDIYVQNYWKQYPGLSGITSLRSFYNEQGNRGYIATYKIKGTPLTSEEVFMELGTQTGDLVHFASGALDSQLFWTIVNSFDSSIH